MEDDIQKRIQAIGMMKPEDSMECHWSPYCTREGQEYVNVHVGDKPFSVWVCEKCKPSL